MVKKGNIMTRVKRGAEVEEKNMAGHEVFEAKVNDEKILRIGMEAVA